MKSHTKPNAATRPVVRVESLTKRYADQVAVDSLSFEVPTGQVIGLLGPNGAGKTTAMKMIVGLVKPTSGRAELLGVSSDEPAFGHALRRVGSLIESPALYRNLSARQNLQLQAKALGVEATPSLVDELLELVDLADRADDRARSYSLGMKQRLGIAVAMVGKPELIILDEPANGLDPAGIVEIRRLLRRLPQMGTTVLVSSHQLNEVQKAADSLVVLDRGRLIACGTTDEIIGSQTSASFQIRLAPDDLASAIAALSAHGVAATTESVDQLSVTLGDGWRGRDLNRLLAEGGVYADQIVHNTVSLEEAFLAMTQGAHQ